MPTRIKARSLAPAAQTWLETSEFAYVLHIFDAVVNLVNAESKVLSIVNLQVGNGPFSVVVDQSGFSEYLEASSQIGSLTGLLQIGDLQIDYSAAQTWTPAPAWPALEPARRTWTSQQLRPLLAEHSDPDSFARLVIAPESADQPWAKTLKAAAGPADNLLRAALASELQAIQDHSAKLAGLGAGLTPAGDDFLVGVMHGLYATLGELNALTLSLNIVEAAIPRTNTLSAAWLEAAARGEAGEPWHELLAAIADEDAAAFEAAVVRILPTGHTSGADALGGFLGILEATPA